MKRYFGPTNVGKTLRGPHRIGECLYTITIIIIDYSAVSFTSRVIMILINSCISLCEIKQR